MEMSQGNSLCIYLKQAKMSLFFYFLLQNQRTGRGGGGGERVQENEYVQILCTCVGKCKNVPIETISGMGRIKEKGG
jgi:hypothetical protein